jgi:hypothetical protein
MALENHRSFPATSKNPCSILRASSTRYAGAIRTWHSTPTLPHSITPRGRIRGRDEDSLPDEACGPIITPAEKSDSQARRAPQIGERSWENEAPGGSFRSKQLFPTLTRRFQARGRFRPGCDSFRAVPSHRQRTKAPHWHFDENTRRALLCRTGKSGRRRSQETRRHHDLSRCAK